MLPERRHLGHAIPEWVDKTDAWFVTICCKQRGVNSLANDEVAACFHKTIGIHTQAGNLAPIIWVLMPDHLHLIAKWNHARGMRRTIADIKRYLAANMGVEWQKGFFDHRLRSDSELRRKSGYVAMNPVRAGLAASPGEWKFTHPRHG
jgi:REP element-mobilizing transposase RayT